MAMKGFIKDIFNLRSNRTAFFNVAPDAASIVTPDRALEIFDTLANMPGLAHGYTDDGCYARAHLMCKQMIGMNLKPEKAWAFETPDNELKVNFPHGEQIWWFHVAPTLGVDTGRGKAFEKMVFDPSLFDGPVTVDHWAKTMNADRKNVHVVPCGKPAPAQMGDYTPIHRTGWRTDAQAEKLMDEYIQLQNEQGFMPQLFPSPLRRAVEDQSASAEAFIRKGGPACPKPKG